MELKVRKCVLCGKDIPKLYTESRKRYSGKRYCSKKCPSKHRGGPSPETAKKISKANKGRWIGKKNPRWAEKLTYSGAHNWVSYNLGKASKCVHCGVKGHPRYHWANISIEYKKDKDDWIELCPKCHIKFDKERGLWGEATRRAGGKIQGHRF